MLSKKLYHIALQLVLIFTIGVNTANASSPADAEAFVKKMSDKVFSVITSEESKQAIQEQLSSLFYEAVDTDWMAQFVLGKYYKDIPAEDLEVFKQTYKRYLANSYVSKFSAYSGQEYKVNGASNLGNNYFRVNTEIVDPSKQQSIAVEYRVRATQGNHMKVVDIKVDGISIILTQRDEYTQFLQDGDIQDLIDKLSTRNAA